jgi:hypothetical protein
LARGLSQTEVKVGILSLDLFQTLLCWGISIVSSFLPNLNHESNAGEVICLRKFDMDPVDNPPAFSCILCSWQPVPLFTEVDK